MQWLTERENMVDKIPNRKLNTMYTNTVVSTQMGIKTNGTYILRGNQYWYSFVIHE
jgi:hypothetical protein